MKTQPTLTIKGYTFLELFQPEGLQRLDTQFLQFLNTRQPEWHDKLLAYRATDNSLTATEISELLINCATVLELFIAQLFGIEEAVAISQIQTTEFNPLASFKKYFVLKRAKKEVNKVDKFPSFSELDAWLTTALNSAPLKTDDREMAIALLGNQYLNQADDCTAEIEKLVQWCTRALTSPDGQAMTTSWTSFHLPERIDYQQLIQNVTTEHDKNHRLASPEASLRLRDGFKLTDPRMNKREVQDEVNYCIYCHDNEGDFCSKGFPIKKGDPAQGFKKNPLDITLTGCPLEEKISEMHFLKKDGYTLAALAMVMVDNPMCPATGHRICNDCMKACIYQKQTPVNIPQIETLVLTDVLDLPWGVEIYDLLTRWNPLRKTQWVMQPYNGFKIMIAGMGPAGFTLAHHLTLEGFAVVGFDGLKIEPLSEKLIKQPIYDFDDLKEALDERIMAGFGGVAEYGITVRWDKNFLKLIYLSLMRRPTFQVFGGVRFGGTITIEDAWQMGFDHFVVAVGAGLPKALRIPHSLAPGMRQANDFLMALQLGNAAKAGSLTNLQIRLPAVIIGGGLTGVDTATEVQAYYITQVEKMLTRYEALVEQYGEDFVHQQLDAASRETLTEYLTHGLVVRKERARAQLAGELPNFIKLAREWGGVTIAYRRSMQESPAYINNHEELQKAFEEGIYYCEGLEPIAVDLNEHGHSEALICHKRIRNDQNEWISTTEEVKLPARAILVATGTQPNTAYEFEHKGTFNRLNLQYQHYEEVDNELHVAHGVKNCKDKQFGPFTSYHQDDKRVSLVGDTHPVFHGNVVKAIASGLRTYPKILTLFKDKLHQDASYAEYVNFAEKMTSLFTATVTSITRKTANVVELVIKAPLAARHYKPGQFFRLQNFETYATPHHHTLLQMEPLAIDAAGHNRQTDELTFLVNETSATARLCSLLKPGEPVTLMGPTGVRAKIPADHETVLIIGNENSFAFLRSFGGEMKASGNRVIYAGFYESKDALYCQSECEKVTDQILWVVNAGEKITSSRENDISVTSDQLLTTLKLNADKLSLNDVDRIYLIVETDLLREFQATRKTLVKDVFVKDPKVIGAVYGNMQCMMKGVCAQCLQWQIDPETGERTKAVFACSWQDQPLEIIDINHIDERQMQNRLHDLISLMWVKEILETTD